MNSSWSKGFSKKFFFQGFSSSFWFGGNPTWIFSFLYFYGGFEYFLWIVYFISWLNLFVIFSDLVTCCFCLVFKLVWILSNSVNLSFLCSFVFLGLAICSSDYADFSHLFIPNYFLYSLENWCTVVSCSFYDDIKWHSWLSWRLIGYLKLIKQSNVRKVNRVFLGYLTRIWIFTTFVC